MVFGRLKNYFLSRYSQHSEGISITKLLAQYEAISGPVTQKQRGSCESINIIGLARAYEQSELEWKTLFGGRRQWASV